MPDLTDLGRANRRKGHQHERNVVAYLRRWFPTAHRSLQPHNSDIENTGELAVECKYTTWQGIPAAVDQAQDDATRRGLARGVVIKKRQGIEDIGQAFWISTVATEMAARDDTEALRARVAELETQIAAAYAAGHAAALQDHRGPSAVGWQPRPIPGFPSMPRPDPAAVPATFRPPAHPEGLPF